MSYECAKLKSMDWLQSRGGSALAWSSSCCPVGARMAGMQQACVCGSRLAGRQCSVLWGVHSCSQTKGGRADRRMLAQLQVQLEQRTISSGCTSVCLEGMQLLAT